MMMLQAPAMKCSDEQETKTLHFSRAMVCAQKKVSGAGEEGLQGGIRKG